jgi:hypothetical protein
MRVSCTRWILLKLDNELMDLRFCIDDICKNYLKQDTVEMYLERYQKIDDMFDKQISNERDENRKIGIYQNYLRRLKHLLSDLRKHVCSFVECLCRRMDWAIENMEKYISRYLNGRCCWE